MSHKEQLRVPAPVILSTNISKDENQISNNIVESRKSNIEYRISKSKIENLKSKKIENINIDILCTCTLDPRNLR